MKKALAFMLVVTTLIPVIAFAATDLTDMTDAELGTLLQSIQQELNNRKQNNTAGNDNMTFYDEKDIKWTITDCEESGWSSFTTLNTIIENNSKYNIIAEFDSLNINGWDVSSFVYTTVGAGKKTKEEVSFDLSDADINKASEISSMEIVVKILNADNYNTIDEKKVTLTPSF